MDKECYCNSFDGKANYFSEFLKMFRIIASSKVKREEDEQVGYTNILKCKKCNSYYIWDSYSEIYSKNDLILAKKYIPKTDEKGLNLILRGIEGIVDENNLEEQSKLSEKLFNIEVNRMVNETQN